MKLNALAPLARRPLPSLLSPSIPLLTTFTVFPLLQGRVYVFANYVCFTSNPFFGYIKKTVIPFQVCALWSCC